MYTRQFNTIVADKKTALFLLLKNMLEISIKLNMLIQRNQPSN
jgi:hypothetical protein